MHFHGLRHLQAKFRDRSAIQARVDDRRPLQSYDTVFSADASKIACEMGAKVFLDTRSIAESYGLLTCGNVFQVLGA